MTEQMNSIESLQTEVNQVKTDLDLLKAETNETIKKTKAESLEQDVSATKEKIKKELDALKGLTDATSLENTRKLEAMLLTLETSNTDLATLKVDINQNNVPSSTPTDKGVEDKEEDEDEGEEEKSDRNRIQRQWDGATSKEEWKNNTGANIARVAGGIGVVAVGVRGIKKLFGRGKKNKEKKEGEDGESTEKKGFWKTGWGKALKILGIGTGGYYLVHALYTGKRGLGDFFDWNKRNETDPDTLKSRYEKNVDAALKPKYESFGEMVDSYHSNLDSTDSLGILEDHESKEVKIPKGCLPAVLDDIYDDVGDILDTDSYLFDKWRYAGQQIRDSVTTMGGKIAGSFFSPLVGVIKGLKETMFGENGEPNEEFKKRAETEDLTRDEQLGNLMQKYGLIRTYLGDKQSQLERKYAEQRLVGQGKNNPTEEEIDDALGNDDCISIVEMRVEASFLRKKIVAKNDENSAIEALSSEGLYNETHSAWMDDLIEEIKERKQGVVPDESIWERANNSTDINKDTALVTELTQVSTNFGIYLDDGFLKKNWVESFASWSGLNFDELWNSKANDIEIMMKEMGFDAEVDRFKLANAEFMDKLSKKTLTKKDIDDFRKSIDEYFSTEQNILLEAQRKNNEDAKKGTLGILRTRAWGRITAIFELVMTPNGLMVVGIVGGLMLFGINLPKMAWNGIAAPGLRKLKEVTFTTVSWGAETVLRRTNVTRLGGVNKRTKLKIYGKNDFNRFATDFKKGRIDSDIAQGVFAARSKERGKIKFQDFLIEELNLIDTSGLKATKQAGLIQQYCNGNVRALMKNGNMNYTLLAKKLNSYHNKLMSGSIVGEKLDFMQELFRSSKFTHIDDIDKIVRNIDNIDITGLSSKQMNKLAKELGKDVSILDDAGEVNKRIKEINQATNVVENLTAAQKQCKTLLNAEIGILEQQLKSATNLESIGIENSIKKLKPWLEEIKNLPDDEAKALTKIFNTGTDVKHISRVLLAEDPISLLKNIEKAGNAVDFEKELRAAKLTSYADELKYANKIDDVFKEFKSVASGLDDVVLLVKQGGKLTKVMRILSKIPVV